MSLTPSPQRPWSGAQTHGYGLLPPYCIGWSKVNLCCPENHALLANALNSPKPGVSVEPPEKCAPATLTNSHEDILTALTNKGLDIRAPNNALCSFKCPKGMMEDKIHTYPDHAINVHKYTVTKDGKLHGDRSTECTVDGKMVTGDCHWDTREFCVGFADQDQDYEFDDNLELTYITCFYHEKPETAAESFKNEFYPVALGISIFFLILTLVVHFWSDKINLNDLSNRMVVAFILNMTIAYIVR